MTARPRRATALGGVICGLAALGATCQPNQEPVARISCTPAAVAVGEPVSFGSGGSIDPDGTLTSFSFAFGDGGAAIGEATSHGYAAPGAYRATLTVRDAAGATDDSSCVVAVGAFPAGSGALDELELVPPHFDPVITEDIEKPEHGGTILGFFRAASNLKVTEVHVNGELADPALGVVRWCEVVDPELSAGEIGIVRCHSSDARFDAGNVATLDVLAGAATVWSKSATRAAPELTPSYVTATEAGDEILVHVRNDASTGRTVTGLEIDGVDVTSFAVFQNASLAPGAVAIVRIPRPDGVPFGRWLAFTVRGTDGPRALRTTRALRLFRPHFGVGDWTQAQSSGAGSPYADPGVMQEYLDRGIDLFLWTPSPSAPPELVLDQLAEQHDIHVWMHEGQPDPAFVAQWGGHPRLLFDAVAGEPEFSDPSSLTLSVVKHNRELWGGTTPLWVYNACMYRFSEWAPLGDVGGMDHYAVWAPKCNTNLPLFFNDLIQYVGSYASEIKRAAEPSPAYMWTQGLYENDVRCPTADEIRAQWYQIVGRGAKTVLWFLGRPELDDVCPASSLAEMRRLKDELVPMRSALLEGDVVPAGTVARTLTPFIDVTATVGPRAIVLTLTDYSYQQLWLTGLVWQPRGNVQIDVTPPGGFEAARFVQLDHASATELAYTKIASNTYRVTVPAMAVATPILVEPEP
ncbi:MAG: PKD domain-containing protein [Deltaproteobacteria bacterium]|nr:PKD domain-containing protein [Deltaproteobacteria bacterium]